MKKYISLVSGVLFGIGLMIACGSAGNLQPVAQSVAQAVANALSINYDNSSSGLSASNVQDAIDELKDLYDSLGGNVSSAGIAGNWSGTRYPYQCSAACSTQGTSINLQFNSNGAYSCTSGSALNVCDTGTDWQLIGTDFLMLSLSNGGYETYRVKKLTTNELVMYGHASGGIIVLSR